MSRIWATVAVNPISNSTGRSRGILRAIGQRCWNGVTIRLADQLLRRDCRPLHTECPWSLLPGFRLNMRHARGGARESVKLCRQQDSACSSVISRAEAGSTRSLISCGCGGCGAVAFTRSVQISVNASGGFASLGKGPHYQRFSSTHIARSKHAGNRRHVLIVGCDVALAIQIRAQLFEHPIAHRTSEAHCQQYELGRDDELAPRDRFEARRRTDPHGMQLRHAAVAIPRKLLRRDAPFALPALFMRALGAKLKRPQRPGRLRRALLRRHRDPPELTHPTCLLTMTRAQAVGAGIATADDDHILSRRKYLARRFYNVAFAAAVLLRQKLHREVDSIQFLDRGGERGWLLRAACEQDRVEVSLQLLDRNANPDMRVGNELHAFSSHLLKAAVEDAFLQLEVWDAVAQQPADPIGLLVHHDLVSGPPQLLRCR